MFRLVLLQTSSGPSPAEISDRRIYVAIYGDPVASETGTDIREVQATYSTDRSAPRTGHSLDADIQALRGVRQNYAEMADPGLSRITAAIAEYESRVNASLAEEFHDRWKSGAIIAAESVVKPPAPPNQIFLLDSPEAWLEVSAANLLDHSRFVATHSMLLRVFEDLQKGQLEVAKESLRKLCNLRLDESTPLDLIHTRLSGSSHKISGSDLVDLLIHDQAYPPSVAILWLIVYVCSSNSELKLISEPDTPEFMSNDNLAEFCFADCSFENIDSLRSTKSNEWDAVLPFLRLITPHARSTRFGGGRQTDIQEFVVQLATLANRRRISSPVMQSLEIAAVARNRPLTHDDMRLGEVLSADSWLEYVLRARDIFGTVASLRASLARAASHWLAIESAPDMERTITYLDQIEFGRVDHALAVERHLLRSRCELTTLIENPANWLSTQDEFERWRQDYRRAYLEDHAEKQVRNRQLQELIYSTGKTVAEIELLEQIEVIQLGTINEIVEMWNETIRLFKVCESDGADIQLIDESVCPECRVRLGQPSNHTDLTDMISEIDRLFGGFRDRLASVVSGMVIESSTPDKLLSLFRLNYAGDLSDLANVLDDKVISFLNDLFGESDRPSGNTGDWASPHF